MPFCFFEGSRRGWKIGESNKREKLIHKMEDKIEKIAMRINDIKVRVGEDAFTELENKIKDENR